MSFSLCIRGACIATSVMVAGFSFLVTGTALATSTASQGDYIKGSGFSDVYFVDDDNGHLVRRPFMNEQIYFTWQEDFDSVATVSDANLAALPLGPLVLPQSGVVLVKIQSANEVYAIEDETLRWITSESVAIDLYGDDWADYVIDLPPTMFPHVTIGDAIRSGEYFSDVSIMKTRSELIATYHTPDADVTVAMNPFSSASFYVDPASSAWAQIASWRATRPTDAAALERIASQPTARWFGDWNDDIQSSVYSYVATVTATGALPVLVAYNIPNRDCGSYSAGGSASDDAYRAWIASFAAGIGTHAAVVILEPDATATSCVTDERLALLGDAVQTLKAQPHSAVYIDAGHDRWIDATTMAERLMAADVADTDGFALNVSNFYTTEENTTYGEAIAERIHNKHFVIDTSRNGNGWNGEWCNPFGRHVGVDPTTDTGNLLIDALLWVKPPGESDGNCNGGPSAGTWWADYALGLVQ